MTPVFVLFSWNLSAALMMSSLRSPPQPMSGDTLSQAAIKTFPRRRRQHRPRQRKALSRRAHFKPVVKLFTPDAQCTWLLTELGLDDIAYGLCDLGMGTPEIGFVCMRELRDARGPLGLPIERDLHFDANKTLSAYADDARAHGRIVT